jgi:cytochrome c biogenesis protein CcdA
MFILSIVFVLIILGLAFSLIGGMLFVHRGHISTALSGLSVTSDPSTKFISFGDSKTEQRSVRHLPKQELLPLPLAA